MKLLILLLLFINNLLFEILVQYAHSSRVNVACKMK